MQSKPDIITQLKHQDILVMSALPIETNNHTDVIYTGLGKVNAALKSIEVIHKEKPKLIINYGSCGAINKNITGLVSIGNFIQHDIDCSPLGFEKGITPFDDIQEISFDKSLYTCGSGDLFVSNPDALKCDVVDMEAYSIAKACYLSKVDFLCFKYISDNADDTAGDIWEENCSKGFSIFINKLKSLYADI